MIQGIIRNARELQNIKEAKEDKIWVAWGAGERGYLFLREARIHKVSNLYIYDSDEKNMPDEKERIFLEGIMENIDRIIFIITVASDSVVSQIENQIMEFGGKIIYRYIPADMRFVREKLNRDGLYNGLRRQKILEDLKAKQLIERKILDGQSFLFARWGEVEGNIVYGDRVAMLTDVETKALKNNAGFWPLDKISVHRFAGIYADAARKIDILCAGFWFPKIEECYEWYSPDALLVSSQMKSPFWEGVSWTWTLQGKKVLVVHPFAKLIEKQYLKRSCLFASQDILPEMDLKAYEAVQSIGGGQNSEFSSWFDALQKMEEDISGIEFDVALIGCGAYGMPIGAFIKSKLHKIAIHIGGTLQLLFGIKGKRWDNSNPFCELYNEHWVRPTEDLRPKNYKTVEEGCYW